MAPVVRSPSLIARAGFPSVHALGLALAGGALLCAAATLHPDRPPLSLFACPFRVATGLPCLTCGCTHAFAFFARGDLRAAFLASPLGALLALACAAHAGWTSLRVAGFPFALALPRPGPAAARALRVLAVLALAANWAFVAFGSRAP